MSAWMILWVVAGFLFALSVQASDELPPDVSAACSGIVRVRSVCVANSGILDVRERTGFLVGAEGRDPYVVTTAEDLEYSVTERQQIAREHQLEENAQTGTEINIIFQGDVEVGVSVVGSSEQKNIAILKPGQTLTDKYILDFSESGVEKGESIWLLGYPSDRVDGDENYSSATVVTARGSILNLASEATNNTKYFSHDIREDSGALGGPFLNEDGAVLGINVLSTEDSGIALTGEEIMQFLELHNIGYTKRTAASTQRRNTLPFILGAVIAAALVLLLIQIVRMRTSAERGGGGSPKDRRDLGNHRGAVLLRLSANEQIPISSEQFILGSSPQKSNYAITGNRRISRAHAMILHERGKYYLADLQSTNGTTLNGTPIRPGVRVKLTSGDVIGMPGEQFEFQ